MSAAKRPIQLEEFTLLVRDLADQELEGVAKLIKNSMTKLHNSNELMGTLLKELEDMKTSQEDRDVYEESNDSTLEDDIKLYRESIYENEVVLLNQELRMEILSLELESRGKLDVIMDEVKMKKAENISQDNDVTKESVYL